MGLCHGRVFFYLTELTIIRSQLKKKLPMSLFYGGLEGGNSGKSDYEDCYLILKVKNLDLNLVGFRLVGESSDNSIRQKPEETELAGSNLLVVHKSLQMKMN